MSAESIRIINAAISRSNGNTITSVDDGSPEAILANSNYEQVVQTALILKPWRFARKTAACTLLPDAPLDQRWLYAWALPDDLLSLRTLIMDKRQPDYDITGDGVVQTRFNTDTYAVYTYRAAEDFWPKDFSEGVTQRLEALFLRLDDRYSQADDRDQSADKQFQRAALGHSQEEAPQDRLMKLPLLFSRRIGYAAFRR